MERGAVVTLQGVGLEPRGNEYNGNEVANINKLRDFRVGLRSKGGWGHGMTAAEVKLRESH